MLGVVIVQADALAPFPLADASVDCVVTSPPYWGLRDYGVPGQLGLERTPAEYVERLVAVFREVWRVLKPTGTVWLNLGDAYCSHSHGNRDESSPEGHWGKHAYGDRSRIRVRRKAVGVKDKDLIGLPWMVAFALRADGWWLRSEVVWAKSNGMPESVRDRPVRSNEKIFLLTKSRRYFYDDIAVRRPAKPQTLERYGRARTEGYDPPGAHDVQDGLRKLCNRNVSHGQSAIGDAADLGTSRRYSNGQKHTGFEGNWDHMKRAEQMAEGSSLRDVWEMAVKGYKGKHYATFPLELPERCIRAGTSAYGCCVVCGVPWVRVRETRYVKSSHHGEKSQVGKNGSPQRMTGKPRLSKRVTTLGWRPMCGCEAEVMPAVVLDPFGGSGTVALAAKKLNRRAVLFELNGEYIHDDASPRLGAPVQVEWV